jgi:hypothetical protein
MPEHIECRMDGKHIVLTNSLEVWVHLFRRKIQLTIPAGFRCDLASIPQMFQWLIPKLGKWNKAAVVHDWFYKNNRLEKDDGEYIATLTRLQVDDLFYQIMKGSGVSWWKRHAMYRAVRLGGWVTWNGYREKERG